MGDSMSNLPFLVLAACSALAAPFALGGTPGWAYGLLALASLACTLWERTKDDAALAEVQARCVALQASLETYQASTDKEISQLRLQLPSGGYRPVR
jgi:hypothetical protein